MSVPSSEEQTPDCSQHPDMVKQTHTDANRHTHAYTQTHSHTHTHTPDEMLTITHHDIVSLASLPMKISMVSGKAKGIIRCCVCVLDSVSYRCCVYRGWAAVASASLVAKRAALPKLYLKPERTALWMGKGERQTVEWSDRGVEPAELGAPNTCVCVFAC